jgi:hypothetical protein
MNELAAIEFSRTKSSLVAIGWGCTIEGGVAFEIFRKVSLEAIDSNETKCNNSINNITLQFCAAVDDGSKGN